MLNASYASVLSLAHIWGKRGGGGGYWARAAVSHVTFLLRCHLVSTNSKLTLNACAGRFVLDPSASSVLPPWGRPVEDWLGLRWREPPPAKDQDDSTWVSSGNKPAHSIPASHLKITFHTNHVFFIISAVFLISGYFWQQKDKAVWSLVIDWRSCWLIEKSCLGL